MVIERTIDTADVDAVVAAQEAAFPGARTRVTEVDESFRYRQVFRGSDRVQRISQDLRARVTASAGGLGFVTVAWAYSGDVAYMQGRTTARADGAVFWGGLAPLAGDVAHADLHAVTVPTEVFVERASRLLGRDLALPTTLVALPAGSTSATARARLDVAVQHALDPVVDATPLVAGAALDAVVAHVIAMFGLEAAGATGRAAPRSLRRALSFIDDRSDEPISVADIAAAAGVSARTLQFLFRQRFDVTPGQYLRGLRLEAARAELLASTGGDTVTAVALRHGFTNRGRFAAAYLARFGELPSETLER